MGAGGFGNALMAYGGVFSAVGGWDWGHAGTASGRDLGGASAGENCGFGGI